MHAASALLDFLGHLSQRSPPPRRIAFSRHFAAADWMKLVMWLVIWLCSLLIASITGLGPLMYPDSPAGHRAKRFVVTVLKVMRPIWRRRRIDVAKLTNFKPS